MAEYSGELAELLPDRNTAPREGVGINVKRLIKLRSKLMLFAFILFAIPMAAVVTIMIPRQYEATAQIEFNAIQQGILNVEGRELSGNTYYNYVNTQAQLITGYPILSRILQNPAVQALPFAQEEGALQFLLGKVKAELENDTELVKVTYHDEDRDSAITVLNTILEEYRDYVYERDENQGDLRRRTLVEKESELATDIERLRLEITELRKASGLPLGTESVGQPEETESLRMNLAQAEADLNAAQTGKRQAESLVARTRALLEQYNQNPSAPIFAQGVEASVLEDPRVTLLLEQLAQAEQEFARQQENYVDTNAPQIQIARGNVNTLQARVDEARSRARKQVLESLLESHQYEIGLQDEEHAGALERRDRFQALLDEYRDQNLARSSEMAEVAEKERIAVALEGNLAQIQNTLLELDIESNAPARANILGQATAPPNPDMSRRLKFLLLALVAAAGAAIAIGILKELSDQTIRSAQDISYITRIPVIAIVPHTSEDRFPPGVNVATLAEDYPSSMTSDEFRQVVARLVTASHAGRPIKTCVVTSSARGDGKSTLACNLAIVLAQADRKVLLLDIDSRNPSVERNFGLSMGPGLSEILSGDELTHDPDRATDYENLFVMGPGLQSEDLVERLASPEMRDFLDGAADLFDHIIVDTPATLLTSETRLLMHLADGVLVVVGAGISSFGMVRRCLTALETGGADILGIVLNAARQAPGGYLRRNIDLYYSHRGVHDPAGRAKPRSATAGRRAAPSIVLMDEDNGED